MSTAFSIGPLNQVRRIPGRGHYDFESVYKIVDAAPIGHVAFPSEQDHPIVVIPMLHARREDTLFFHGAQSSRLMKYLASGQPVTASFALVDGLVLAKSLFHHSMNYRSAVVFGVGREIADNSEKLAVLKVISDKLVPSRWENARQPNAQELKATMVVGVTIETASAKVRTGGPKEEPDDVDLPIWSGIVPWITVAKPPEPDSLSQGLPVPSYLCSPIERM